MRVLLSVLAGLLTSAAYAGHVPHYRFHSEGVAHEFTYDPWTAAVPLPALASAEVKAQPFARLGAMLVPRGNAVLEDDELGIPMWLGNDVMGILTKRVLVAADSEDTLRALVPAEAAIALMPYSDDVYVVTLPYPETAMRVAEELYGKPGIRFAHPDFRFEIEARGADPRGEPLFPAQWHLAREGVPAAWTVTTGRPETLVAVLDLGFEQAHPDMQGAWYVNPREIPGNHRDDDGNGYVDDVSGWNFAINGTNLIYGAAPNHGTCTSGIIGARANGIGVTGLCPDCTVLPLVVDQDVANAAAAFHYARAAGAAVASNSWGYSLNTPRTDAVVDAIAKTAREGRGGKGTTVVFAMSNYHKDDCRGPSSDISGLPTVVAVSSVDKQDKKVNDAGYGPCLKLVASSAPSQDEGIATTDRPGDKGYNTGARATDFPDLAYTNTFYGTSAAAPQVAGAFGLVYSAHPEMTAAEALALLTQSAEKVSAAEAAYDPATGLSTMYGYGRLDVGRALARWDRGM